MAIPLSVLDLSAFLNVVKRIQRTLVSGGNLRTLILDCGENIRTPHGIARVWPRPGKEPLKNVNGTVVVTIHHESTFRAMIRPFPQGHWL